MIKLEDLTYEQCVEQGLGPLVFPHRLEDEGIRGLGDERVQMKAVCIQNMQMQAKMGRVLECAWRALTEAGIQPVLMKGAGLAAYYPEPSMRQWSDIDLFVGKAQYHPACAAMRKAFPDAFKFDEELDHYKHYNLIADGVSIEIHRVSVALTHPRDIRRYERMERFGMAHAIPLKYINTDTHADGAINIKEEIKNAESPVADCNLQALASQSACEQAPRQIDHQVPPADSDTQSPPDSLQKCAIAYENNKNNSATSSYENNKNNRATSSNENNKNEIVVPEPTFNALMVMLHAWEHFITKGANIRQICDLALLLKHTKSEIDAVRLKRWLKDLRALDVWQIYMGILVHEFGMREEEVLFYNERVVPRAQKMIAWILNDPRQEQPKIQAKNRLVRKWRTMKKRMRNAERIAQFSPAYARHMKAAVWLSGLTRLFAPDRRWE